VCDADAGYVRTGKNCTKCWARGVNILLLILLPLLLIIFIIWIALYRKVKARSAMQVLMRISLTYLQTLGTLGTLYVARGTDSFRDMMGFAAVVGDSVLSIPSVQCELRIGYYRRLAFTLCFPFLIALSCMLVMLIALAWMRCRQKSTAVTPLIFDQARLGKTLSLRDSRRDSMLENDDSKTVTHWNPLERMGRVPSFAFTLSSTAPKNSAHEALAPVQASSILSDLRNFFFSSSWLPPVIFVLNAGYSSLTGTCFSVFDCPYTVKGVSYLRADLSVACNTPAHKTAMVLAGVLIVLFMGGFPLMFAFILRRRRDQLNAPRVFEKFGFLYDGYSIDRGMYAWESIIMVRKAGVVMIGALVRDSYFQIIAATIFMTTFLFLQAYFHPYNRRMYNVMESVSLLGIIMTQTISTFFLRSENLMSGCSGASLSKVVDVSGRTCRDVQNSAATSDIVTTFLLAAINVILLLAMLGVMFHNWRSDGKRLPAFCARCPGATPSTSAESDGELPPGLSDNAKTTSRASGNINRMGAVLGATVAGAAMTLSATASGVGDWQSDIKGIGHEPVAKE
jgi:hypothetical protein